MHLGETVTTTISCLPVPVTNIKSLYVVFKYGNRTILEKTLDDCTLNEDDNTISFKLNQNESLSLQIGVVKRSLVIITKDGTRLESCPSEFSVQPTVKDEVL